jgi:hypothetical protein
MSDTIKLDGSYAFETMDAAIEAQDKLGKMKIVAILDLDGPGVLSVQSDVIDAIPHLLGLYDRQEWKLIKRVLRQIRSRRNVSRHLRDLGSTVGPGSFGAGGVFGGKK